MTFKIFGQILDKATLWTVLDGQLPNFLDIGRTLDRNFWKLAPLVPAAGRIKSGKIHYGMIPALNTPY